MPDAARAGETADLCADPGEAGAPDAQVSQPPLEGSRQGDAARPVKEPTENRVAFGKPAPPDGSGLPDQDAVGEADTKAGQAGDQVEDGSQSPAQAGLLPGPGRSVIPIAAEQVAEQQASMPPSRAQRPSPAERARLARTEVAAGDDATSGIPDAAVAAQPADPEAASPGAAKPIANDPDGPSPAEGGEEPAEEVQGRPADLVLPLPPLPSLAIETGSGSKAGDGGALPPAPVGGSARVTRTVLDARPATIARADMPSGPEASALVPARENPLSPTAGGPARSPEGAHLKATGLDPAQAVAAADAAPRDGSAPAKPAEAPPLSGPAVAPPSQIAAGHGPVPGRPGDATITGSRLAVGDVPVEIGLRSLAGVNRFEIRLAPEHLGAVSIRLDMGEPGGVRAHLVVDTPDALAALQREAPRLERALEQAGFKPAEGGVSMSLRDPGPPGGGQDGGQGRGGGFDDPRERPRPAMPPAYEGEARAARDGAVRGSALRLWARTSGVDLRI